MPYNIYRYMIIWSQTALISHSLVMLVVGRPVCEIQVSTREKIKIIPMRKSKNWIHYINTRDV